MSEHHVSIEWQRNTEGFKYEEYTRDHLWRFPGGSQIPASAAPGYRGSEQFVDPEEALVAAISSCHMLSLLAIASRKKLTISRYEDNAVGFLEKNEDGMLAVTRVILRPKIIFETGVEVSDQDIQTLHDQAHHQCFIANSVKTEISVEAPPIKESVVSYSASASQSNSR